MIYYARVSAACVKQLAMNRLLRINVNLLIIGLNLLLVESGRTLIGMSSQAEKRSSKGPSQLSTDSPKDRLFSYSDTSDVIMPKLVALLKSGDYNGVFRKSTDELDGMNDFNGKPTENVINQDLVQQATQPASNFLYVSDPSSHTRTNCYIVKLSNSVEGDMFRKLSEVFGALEAKVHRTYRHGFKGYTLCFPDNVLPLSIMKEIPWIEHVERENVVRAVQTQENAPWGLARLSRPDVNSKSFGFDSAGRGVSVFVIDSGLYANNELGNRGRLVYSAFPDSPSDCSGHGTQVASIIGGTNVGVAKLANVNVLQVLDCDGNGSNSDLIDGINFVIANHQKPAVINLSLGGPRSPSVDQAVRAAVDAGIFVVVAAGNENTDACTQSPAAVAEAVTVAAIAQRNTRAKFSNYGPCVDIFAPGVDILTAAIPAKSRNGYVFGSGTSFSAPFVAGVAALLLESNPKMSPQQLTDKILGISAKSILSPSTLLGSPNLLLQAPPVRSSNVMLVRLTDPSKLPAYGYHMSSIASVELILIIIAAICTLVAILATSATMFMKYRANRMDANNVMSDADIKASVFSSRRPSVFL